MSTKLQLLLVTFPNKESAKEVADKLLNDALAVCVQFDSVESFFYWDGQVQSGDEVRAMIKIVDSNYKDAVAIIEFMHPYDVPQILAINIDKGFEPYIQWALESSKK